MGKTELDETYIFKISIIFYVTIGIKIPFFRVLVTIELGRSLLQFVTTNCLIWKGQIGSFFYLFIFFWFTSLFFGFDLLGSKEEVMSERRNNDCFVLQIGDQ